MPAVASSAASPGATGLDQVDEAVAACRAAAPGWAITSLGDRSDLLEAAMADTLEASHDWVAASQAAKGISRGQRACGEEWLNGPSLVVRNLRLLRDTLADIVTTGRPQPPDVRTRADGRTVVAAHPTDVFDRLLLPGHHGEIVLRDGVSGQDAVARMGEVYRPGHDGHGGQVAVVLGAGNVSSIPPMDVLTQLFARRRTVVLKMNPVTEVLGPHVERALRAFVARDLLRVVYGGADVGAHLVRHRDVDAVHVTGSDKTHDAIVFGPGEDGQRRKAADDPALDKELTAELGNVTPVIVVPGPWDDDDIATQADAIASMLVNNAGFNCIAARVVVTHRDWNRRRPLLDAVRTSLALAEDRAAWYPGAADRWQRFVDAHRDVEQYGGAGQDHLPFTLLGGLDPDDPDDIAFTTEAFCSVFGEVALPAHRSVPAFLDDAVDFCNERLWGTLSAMLLVHPATLRDPAAAAAIERAIERLEYGSVAVNAWSGVAYGTVALPWGGAPGSPATDIQSGSGFVHNTWLVPDDQVDKVVLRAPFRPVVKSAVSHTHRTSDRVGRLLTEFEATRNLAVLARLVLAALRG